MSEELMTTKEVAHYLGIHEKQVYALIKEGSIPCTKLTGKWIFPRRLIDEWLDSDSRKGMGGARNKAKSIDGALLAAGSNDPVLDILLNSMKRKHPDFFIFSATTGSTAGLRALNEGHTDIAWSHLLDTQSGGYTVPFISSLLPDKKIAVVNLFYRRQGLIFSRELEGKIGGLADIVERDLRIVNRQEGSGTRVLLDHELGKIGAAPERLRGYDREVYTHLEVGLNILSGRADAGIATVAVSRMLGLPFVPIARESFDMVLPQSIYFEKGVQLFIETLKSQIFRDNVSPLGDYGFEDSGTILYSSQ